MPVVENDEEEEETADPVSVLVVFKPACRTHKAMKLNDSTVSSRLSWLRLQSDAVKETATIQRYEKIRLKRRTYPGYTARKKAKG